MAVSPSRNEKIPLDGIETLCKKHCQPYPIAGGSRNEKIPLDGIETSITASFHPSKSGKVCRNEKIPLDGIETVKLGVGEDEPGIQPPSRNEKIPLDGIGGGQRDEGFGIGVLGFAVGEGFLWRAKV